MVVTMRSHRSFPFYSVGLSDLFKYFLERRNRLPASDEISMRPNLETERKMKMRSSTRPSFFALVIGLWIISCAIVFVSVLVAPPARGRPVVCEQGECFSWSPRSAQPVESAGEIVLTFTSYEPGRVVYYTSDGDCSGYPLDPPDCGRPQARESEDYGAVKGEWIFTEAGSRTIRIPIFDDDDDEADYEAFTVNASRYDDVAEQTVWDNVSVRIVDDDPKRTSDSSTSPGRSNRQIAGPQTGSPTRPAPPPATTSSSSEPTDSGNRSGVVNPGDPTPEVEGSAGNEAKPIAADTLREDNFLPTAGLRALALVTIAAVGFALKKRFERRTT